MPDPFANYDQLETAPPRDGEEPFGHCDSCGHILVGDEGGVCRRCGGPTAVEY